MQWLVSDQNDFSKRILSGIPPSVKLRGGDHPHCPPTKKKKTKKKKKKAGTNFPFTEIEKACVDLF